MKNKYTHIITCRKCGLYLFSVNCFNNYLKYTPHLCYKCERKIINNKKIFDELKEDLPTINTILNNYGEIITYEIYIPYPGNYDLYNLSQHYYKYLCAYIPKIQEDNKYDKRIILKTKLNNNDYIYTGYYFPIFYYNTVSHTLLIDIMEDISFRLSKEVIKKFYSGCNPILLSEKQNKALIFILSHSKNINYSLEKEHYELIDGILKNCCLYNK